MIYILAGSCKEAEFFAKRRRINKRDFYYIHSEKELLGTSPSAGDMMVSVGTFYSRPDRYEIIKRAVSSGFIINHEDQKDKGEQAMSEERITCGQCESGPQGGAKGKMCEWKC